MGSRVDAALAALGRLLRFMGGTAGSPVAPLPISLAPATAHAKVVANASSLIGPA